MIVTSYLFDGATLDFGKLEALSQAVGKERLVRACLVFLFLWLWERELGKRKKRQVFPFL